MFIACDAIFYSICVFLFLEAAASRQWLSFFLFLFYKQTLMDSGWIVSLLGGKVVQTLALDILSTERRVRTVERVTWIYIYTQRERESYIYMTGVYITVCVYNWVIEFTVVMDVQVEVLATVFPPKFRSTRIGRTRNFRRTKSLFFIFFFFKLAKRRSYFLFFFFL